MCNPSHHDAGSGMSQTEVQVSGDAITTGGAGGEPESMSASLQRAASYLGCAGLGALNAQ